MKSVSPKKNLGQHFLNDLNIAQKIADPLQNQNCDKVLEIGPGMGVVRQVMKIGRVEIEVVRHFMKKHGLQPPCIQFVNDGFVVTRNREDFKTPGADQAATHAAGLRNKCNVQ